MRRRIDFNCDLGEGCGSDAAIIPLISSASIACGAHAGDDGTMRAALRLCREHSVAAGAHPSFEDREHFGRRIIEMPPADIHAMVLRQLQRMGAIAVQEGVHLAHVKPHGALYNLAARDIAVADAIAGAVAEFDATLRLYALADSQLIAASQRAGLQVVQEAFAERGYTASGALAPRGTPRAELANVDEAIAQVRQMLQHHSVHTVDGSTIPIQADSICLHGDRADAAEFARALRQALEDDGILIAAPGEPTA